MQDYEESHTGWWAKPHIEGGYEIIDANGWALAKINYDYRYTCNSTNHYRANLFAAAPDMLEALTNARSQLSALGGTAGVHMGDEDAHESGCDMVQRAVIMQIDSAIAKAEGRS